MSRRRLLHVTPVFLALLICMSTVFPQSAESVIDKYLKAVGGKAAIEKIQTRVMKGTFLLPDMGMEGAMTMYLERPDKIYSEIELPGFGVVTSGLYEDVAWSVNPMEGPRLQSGSEKESTLRQASLEMLADWKKFFSKAELVGNELVGGKTCSKVTLTSHSGNPVSLFFEDESGLLVRAVDSREGQVFISEFTDYQVVDEIKVPFNIAISTPQIDFKLALSSVENNVEIPAERFELPAEIQKLVAK